MLTVLLVITIQPLASVYIPFIQVLEINYSRVIITLMDLNLYVVVNHGVYRYMMNKLDRWLLILKEVVQVSQDIVIVSSALNLNKMIQISLFLQVGIKTSRSGILDNQVHAGLFMAHTFVVIQLIYMTGSYWQDPIKTPSSFNYGTSAHVSTSKISPGMKAFRLTNPASCMHHNSRRIQVISLFQVVVELMKLRYLMLTICSNHALKSEA